MDDTTRNVTQALGGIGVVDLFSQSPPTWHGELCLARQAEKLLGVCWGQQQQPQRLQADLMLPSSARAAAAAAEWLLSLEVHFRLLRKQGEAEKGGGKSASVLDVRLLPSSELLPERHLAEGAEGPADAGPVSEAALAALLRHPRARVRAAAASAIRELVLLRPLASLRFLPAVLSQLSSVPPAAADPDRIRGSDYVDPDKAVAAAQAPLLLAVLPAMSADASVAPFAARAAAPLGGERAPLLLRCVALRMVVQGWLVTGTQYRALGRVESCAVEGWLMTDRRREGSR
jgi:hypothetical protein